jgi:hypothetical protein
MHCSEQDQIYQLESKVNSLLRRLEELEIELNELKNLNAIVIGIEKIIESMDHDESSCSPEINRMPKMPRMV